MDTIVIALISVIACVVLFAFYFQFKFVGVDARTRDAEKVATKFTSVLEATTVGEDIKKNYQAVQTRLSDLQEENDFNTEDVSAQGDEIEHLKKENRLMREYYGKLVEVVKGLPVENATIPDLTLPEISRSNERDREDRHRYESEDEDDYYPPARGSRAPHGGRSQGRPSRYEKEPTPRARVGKSHGRPTRHVNREEEEPIQRARGAPAHTEGRRDRRSSRYGNREEEEPIQRARGGRNQARSSRYEDREVAHKERRGRNHYDGYESDDFLP